MTDDTHLILCKFSLAVIIARRTGTTSGRLKVASEDDSPVFCFMYAFHRPSVAAVDRYGANLERKIYWHRYYVSLFTSQKKKKRKNLMW